jgi:Thioredoxin
MQTSTNTERMLSYAEYMNRFEAWVANGETSSLHATPDLILFTKLNWSRTQRIQKTLTLEPAFEDTLAKLDHHLTWIVLTEAWCGDSAQNLPAIAAIANLRSDKINIVIALRDEHPELMAKHLTNGSKSIPILIAIDDKTGTEVFKWGPRPQPAQEMLTAWKLNPNGRTWDDFERELHSWYAKDKTATVQAEFLALLRRITGTS